MMTEAGSIETYRNRSGDGDAKRGEEKQWVDNQRDKALKSDEEELKADE